MEPNDELLSAYLDDELSDVERTQVEQRLDTDDAYRRRYEDYQALREAVQKLPRHRLGDGFAKHILNLIETKRETSEPTTKELSPIVSESTPRRWIGNIPWWAVASLAAGIVFVLWIPSLPKPKNGMATRLAEPNNEQAVPKELAPTEHWSFGVRPAAPENPVNAESMPVDAEKSDDDLYSLEILSEREAVSALAFSDEAEEDQAGKKAANTGGIEATDGFETFAGKAGQTHGNLGLGQFDFVVTATGVDHRQLRAALDRQGIVLAGARINSERNDKSLKSDTSLSLASPDEQLSQKTVDATDAQSAATPKAATATTRGFGGGGVGDSVRKSGERVRTRADFFEYAVEQNTATQYVLVEASQQRIEAVMRDLTPYGARLKALSKTPAETESISSEASAGKAWSRQLEVEEALERIDSGQQRPTSDPAPAPVAAADDERTAKSAPDRTEFRRAFKTRDAETDSDLDAPDTPRLHQQVRRQTTRFADVSGEPAQQSVSEEARQLKSGPVSGGIERRVRVLFVLRTPQSGDIPENSSPAQPARQ